MLVTTVEGKKEMFTNRSIKAATEARKLEKILMSPGERSMAFIYGINLIRDSSVTIEDLSHDNQIYGTNLNRLKENTANSNIPKVQVELAAVPSSILSL